MNFPSPPSTATLAAIDAGSNAIRLSVARALPNGTIRPILKERMPVRLGRPVFAAGAFDEATIAEAVRAFREFRALFLEYGVERYRAVATSATREARNREALVEAVAAATGIELEVVDGVEEARLARVAILGEFEGTAPPDLIADLGGGSLEINVLRDGAVVFDKTLPLGTVRLMEAFEGGGAIGEELARDIAAYAAREIRRETPEATPAVRGAASGGNAETLAQIFPGAREGGIRALDLASLRAELPRMLRSDPAGRIRQYDVRRDRAEVLPFAAIVLLATAERFGLDRWLVPGVGVREGVLRELAAESVHATG